MSDVANAGKDTFVEPEIVPGNDGTAVVHMPKEIESRGDRPTGRDREEEDEREGSDTSGGGERPSRNQARRRHQRAKAREREDQIGELATIVGSQQRMLQALSRGQSQQALATLEREAQDARAAYAEGQRRHAQAVEKGDGVGAAGGGEPASERSSGGQPRLTRTQVRDMNELKEDFLDKHPWIDPDSDDDVQLAIRAIDAKVAKDFKPYTQDYWDELSERIDLAGLNKEKKPVRREAQDDDRTSRREDRREDRREQPRRRARDDDADDDGRGGPPIGGAGRDRGTQGGTSVKLTAEMVTSLEAAGIPLTGGDEDTRKRRARIMSQWANKPA